MTRDEEGWVSILVDGAIGDLGLYIARRVWHREVALVEVARRLLCSGEVWYVE